MTDKQYAFDYRGIRLTEKDLGQWQRAYGYIDVRAELTQIADNEEWMGSLGNRWFFAVSSLLAKRNRAAHDRKIKSLGYNGIEGVL